MAQDAVYADLLDSLSPLSAAGIDPDEARLNRAGTMAKLGLQAQNDIPPQPGMSPNGNSLPPGMRSRTGTAQADEATVPIPALPDDLAAANAITIRRGQEAYGRGSEDLKKLAAQPDLSTVTEPLERQRVSAQRRQVELEKPYDPQTGKLLQEYKPNFGQKFMRGVEGFARGGVLGAVNPGMTGAQPYGAPNKYLGMDQRQAAGQVAGADQQLTQAAANWKAQNDRLKGQASEDRAQATALKDVTGASVEQQKIPIEQQAANSKQQEAFNASPVAKGQVLEQDYGARKKQADTLGLKGQNRTLFLANGKIPDPRQATGEEIARAQATAAWHRDNPGKQPGLEDIRGINAAVSGSEIKNTGKGGGKPIPPALQNKILDEKKAGMEGATAQLRAGMSKTGAVYTKEDWQADMQAAQDKFEAAIEAEGGTVNHMTINPDGSWKAAAASAAPAAKATLEAPNIGDERKGYIYQGGDPSKQSNWKPKPKAKK